MGVTARATKKQVKEVKAMLDGTDRNSDEKLRLLNAKYLQQVRHIPPIFYFLLLASMSSFGTFGYPCLPQLDRAKKSNCLKPIDPRHCAGNRDKELSERTINTATEVGAGQQRKRYEYVSHWAV
jgi:hypothetical protein